MRNTDIQKVSLLRVSAHKEAPCWLFLPDNVCHKTFTIFPVCVQRAKKTYDYKTQDSFSLIPSGKYHYQYLFALSLKGLIVLPLDHFSFDMFSHFLKSQHSFTVSGCVKNGIYGFSFCLFSAYSLEVIKFCNELKEKIKCSDISF